MMVFQKTVNLCFEGIPEPMEKMFSALMRALVDSPPQKPPLAGFDAGEQFIPDLEGDTDVARNINAAFLIRLSGEGHGSYGAARQYLDALKASRKWGNVAQFMGDGAELVRGEIEALCRGDVRFKAALKEASAFCTARDAPQGGVLFEKMWEIFFPEGVDCLSNQKEKIMRIRAHRQVRITKPNPSPIDNPAREVLFLSNLLVTTPASFDALDRLPHEARMIEKLKQTMEEEQRYWFDHPIQIGVLNENNEALYGLRGLDNALEFEKKRGSIHRTDKLTCLLSVSVTHEGLHGIVKPYLREVYNSTEPFRNLNIYLFTENDTDRMNREILLPAMEKYTGVSKGDALRLVFGVDGEYGRHYSFLKAMSAFWQVLMDSGVKGSFKLDLDQVFDQEALVRETGSSALEHFKTPLWGAKGEDAAGNPVDLGLMAGALVNAEDVSQKPFHAGRAHPGFHSSGEASLFSAPFPWAFQRSRK
jgi:hypothetical protein